jgi:GNAT superfamily N-acetyltransferase
VSEPQVHIRPARPDEGDRLRELASASKGHWGYEPEQIRRWVEGGDFSPAGLRGKLVFVADANGDAVAWAAVIPKGEVMWLEDMWVDPPWIGKGLGSLLFDHALALAREHGARSMEWEAEPHAVGFYQRVGGRHLRDSEPTEFGRVVPVMGIAVD